jgi:hypothetical protein
LLAAGFAALAVDFSAGLAFVAGAFFTALGLAA